MEKTYPSGARGLLQYMVLTLLALTLGTLIPHWVLAADGPNLIQNPSLEVDDNVNNIPDHWATGRWGTNTAVFSYPVTGVNGAKATKIDITAYTNGDAKWYFEDVPVSAGTTYHFKDQYLSTVTTTLTVRYADATGKFTYLDIATLAPSNTWASADVTLTPPIGTVSLTVFHLINRVGSLTIDNANLAAVDATPAPSTPTPTPPVSNPANLIPNPSLEIDDNANNIPDHWAAGRWGTNTTTFTYPVSGVAGVKAAKIDISAYTNGDAKWYFEDVPVTTGQTYTFSDQYLATLTSALVVRYTSSSGTVTYVDLGTVPASTTWQTVQKTFTVPSGIVSATVFHLIQNVGSLTVDNFSLLATTSTPTPTPTGNFSQGFVSLTFDDGLASHITTVKPKLDAAQIKGTFYLTSGALAWINNASLENDSDNNNLPDGWTVKQSGSQTATFTYPVAGFNSSRAAKVTVTNYQSGEAEWAFDDIPVIADYSYTFSDNYQSTVSSNVIAIMKDVNGVAQTLQLGTVPASATWSTFSKTFHVPVGIVSVAIYHRLTQNGSLTLDNFNLVNTSNSFIRQPDALTLQAAGHEIGSHTRTHPDLTSLTNAQVLTEINGNISDLQSMGITGPITSIAYPYGTFNSNVEALIQTAGLTSGRTVKAGYNLPTTDKYSLFSQSVSIDTTLNQVKGWIDQANTNHTWLILNLHQIEPLSVLQSTGAVEGTTPEILQGILDYLKTTNTITRTVNAGMSLMNSN